MVIGTDVGTASYEVSIPATDMTSPATIAATSYEIGGRDFPGGALVGQVIRNGSLTAVEKAAAEAEMVVNGAEASYGAVTDMSLFWRGRSEVTQFPLIDTSSCTNLSAAWANCTNQVTVPAYDTPLVENFFATWFNNSSLVTMTWIDTSSGTIFRNVFYSCRSLTNFPENFFDYAKGGDFDNAFINTNLSEESIDNILVSLVTSGIETGTRRFSQSDGQPPSVGKGQPAIDTLRARGWTVNVTGGYVTP
jgi:hypothetical protein